ncbi:hypothetical protein DDE01_09140 [Desulfovibrio desulfuricans]|nr:hypothetical protein DDE01_09140 [Desulfovibrio desulfuricans]
MEMVHAHERNIEPECEPLGEGHPHEQAAQQPRATGHRNRVEFSRPDARFPKKQVVQGAYEPVVLARRDLWHDTTEQRMDVCLTGHDGMHKPAVTYKRKARLIARGLYSDTEHSLP